MSRAIVLTGPEGNENPLAAGLEALDVAVLRMPLLEIAPPEDRGPLLRAARALATYDCVVFPSPRAVESLAAALAEAGIPGRTTDALAVGPGTAARAAEAGFRVVVEGSDAATSGAAALLEAVDASAYAVGRKRILLPSSERARPDLLDGLRSRGATVDAVAAYTVRPVANAAERLSGLCRSMRVGDDGPPPLLVASPSAAEVLASAAAAVPRGLPKLVAIGPTTARAMEGLGLAVAARAAAPTPAGVRDALLSVEMTAR